MDLAKAPILLDYGTFVVADAYRFATSGLGHRDPVSWRFEASRDGTNWVLLEEQLRHAVILPPHMQLLHRHPLRQGSHQCPGHVRPATRIVMVRR